MKRHYFNRILALALTAVLSYALLSPLTAAAETETALTEVEVDLREGSVRVEDVGTSGRVRCVLIKADGTEQQSKDLDPAATRFIFTTGGEVVTACTLNFLAKADLHVTLKNCKMKQTSEWSNPFNGQGGNVDLLLKGENQLWGGSKRWGLQIPEGMTYTVSGPGLLSVDGAVPVGNSDSNGSPAPTGTLRMNGGAILSESDNGINSNVVYAGGSLRCAFRGDTTIKSPTGLSLYLLPLDFSEAVCAPYITDGVIMINNFPIRLDAAKKAYLYLTQGTTKVELSTLDGSFTQTTPIPRIYSTDSESYVVLMTDKIAIITDVHPTTFSADLRGFWSPGINWRERSFELVKSSSETVTMKLSGDVVDTKYQTLSQDREYKYRACGTPWGGSPIYTEWVTFRTQKVCMIRLDGGTVTAGTPISTDKYLSGDEITVTADWKDDRLFSGWYEGETLVSANPAYTFVVENDRTLTARFAAVSDTVTYPADANVTLTNSGDGAWFYQNGMLCSGKIQHTQSSAFTLTVDVPETGFILAFDWRASSESSDRLTLIHNETDIENISGNQSEFSRKVLYLPPGPNTVTWRYTKDDTLDKFEDRTYLKNISLKPVSEVTIKAVSNNSGYGTVEPASQTAPQLAEVVLTAEPKPGYYLSAWKDPAGTVVSHDLVYRFTALTDETYTAEFAVSPDYSGAVQDGTISLYPAGGSVTPWTVETGGVLKSGAVGDEQSSALAGSITVPPGETRILSFVWKVSSEADCDKLAFSINGEHETEISGIGHDWQRYAVTLTEGDYTLKWVYGKDTSDFEGDDCGWLKNISLSPVSEVTIKAVSNNSEYGTAEPASQTVRQLAEVVLTAEPKPGYHLSAWKDQNGTIVSHDLVYRFTALTDGTYTAEFAEFPDYSGAVQDGTISLYPAGGSDALWTVETGGVLKSGAVGHSQNSALGGNITVPPGEMRILSFVWKVSSEGGCDKLAFSINGEHEAEISGVGHDWQRYAVTLPVGDYTLKWVYEKDASVIEGSDCGWLKAISLRSPQQAGTVSAGTSSQNLGTASVTMEDGRAVTNPVPLGSKVTFTATAKNYGVFLGWKDADGAVVSLEPTFTAVVDGDLAYTAQFSEEKVYYDEESERVVALLSTDLPKVTLVTAAYDAKGVLVSQRMLENINLRAGRSAYNLDEEFTPVKGGTVKVFLWEDLNSLRPVPLNQNRAE